ncbi:alkaline phosphatase family protein [Ornithinimicrobium cryptoxanthini]|uniref:Alkaline phosphatase family protein n=1 Tax=Ornithinimicrobium cryptoxanthini TaxID=2934161 RepID=A0ABY4YLK0_9MICO|nr:nucleotide pyrophosphatase/phosphodiesterase family protein [Ornithinimicrobium cryptoxanthini]USQ77619.1 alkaline phosphatase family protein [Ornithinimicrobium cryptoxanthini]
MVALPSEFIELAYAGSLATVLPAVAQSLGVSAHPGAAPLGLDPLFELPPARSAVLVLVDGLGAEQLRRRSGHAQFLRSLQSPAPQLTCGFPATTATSLASLGTGLPPGAHGMVGWQVLMPEHDRLLNHLSWDEGPDPEQWQPHRTVFEQLEAGGVAVTRIGPGYFDGSGMTRAAQRGGSFAAARTLPERVDTAIAALTAAPRSFVYLYWGEVDKIGHTFGPDSWQWGEEVERTDAALADLAMRLPPGTSLTVTADHGMVEAPEMLRHDLAWDEDLARGIRHLGGDPRVPQPHCEPGAAAEVLETWTELLGEQALVVSRAEAIDHGWFGPVEGAVTPRIGDLVVAMRGHATVLDSRAQRPEFLALKGHHGSLTRDEMAIPLLHLPAVP